MIEKLYDWIMRKAESKDAIWVLLAISFAESSFFPLPPDPILAVVVAKNKHKTFKYASLCALASVLGGFLGYLIGYAVFAELGEPILGFFGVTPAQFQEMVEKMGRDAWAFGLICFKGLTPIPFKIVTIASGFAHVNLVVFAVASIITRTSRFLILSYICKRYGDFVLNFIEKHKKFAVAAVIIGVIVGFALIKLFAMWEAGQGAA